MAESAAAGRGVETVRISDATDGQRIDNFLIARMKGVPRSRLYRLLRRGEVRVNKGRVKPDYRLKPGDLVRIPPLRMADDVPCQSPPRPVLEALESAILYEDERLLVLDKPSRMAVHGGSGLAWGLIEAMRALRPEAPALELVHRLDRETSGCLLLSKDRRVLGELHRLIRDQAVDKRYLALLVGKMRAKQQWVDAPLRKNLLQGGERVVRVDSGAGRPARTLFRRLRRIGDFTLVEAAPVTGRTHQIRVHAAHLGLPVAGDEKYGADEGNRRLRGLGLKRLFLHASALTFTPTFARGPLHVEAPMPAALQDLVHALEGHRETGA